jgi:hypothetical protein
MGAMRQTKTGLGGMLELIVKRLRQRATASRKSRCLIVGSIWCGISKKRSAARTNDTRPNIRCAPNKAKATPVQPGGRGGGEALGLADDRHDQILALEQAFGRGLGVGERHRLDLGVLEDRRVSSSYLVGCSARSTALIVSPTAPCS